MRGPEPSRRASRATRRIACFALLLACCGGPAAAQTPAQTFSQSAYVEPVALPTCDPAHPEVAIIDSVAAWARVNDPEIRVFCVRPGDYRAAGRIRLETSGTAVRPRVLRYENPAVASAPHPVHQAPGERATIRALELWSTAHWVVSGLAIQDAEIYGVRFEDANFNVLDRLLVENATFTLVRFRGTSSQNTLQNSVIRSAPVLYGRDRTCVTFDDPGANRRQKENRLVQNEISDCSDGIQLYVADSATSAGTFTGLVIDENDIYLTSARRSDCNGRLDPSGPCACAEEGIDVKLGGAGPEPDRRVTISNNRIWGWLEGDHGRTGDKSEPCGGTGSWGGLVQVHRLGRHVAILDNRLLDSPRGVTLGITSRQVAVRGNLFHGIDEGQTQPSHALSVGGPDHQVEANTVVASGNWLRFAERTNRTQATCNVAVQSARAGGETPGSGSVVDFNSLVATPQGRTPGANDLFFAGLENAGGEVCFARRRWTAPETVCVPHGGPLPATARASGCGRGAPGSPLLLQ